MARVHGVEAMSVSLQKIARQAFPSPLPEEGPDLCPPLLMEKPRAQRVSEGVSIASNV